MASMRLLRPLGLPPRLVLLLPGSSEWHWASSSLESFLQLCHNSLNGQQPNLLQQQTTGAWWPQRLSNIHSFKWVNWGLGWGRDWPEIMGARSALCLLLLCEPSGMPTCMELWARPLGEVGAMPARLIRSRSVSSMDYHKTQRTASQTAHEVTTGFWRRQRPFRHQHAMVRVRRWLCWCSCVPIIRACACVWYACTHEPVWVVSGWMPSQMCVCMSTETVCVYVLENMCLQPPGCECVYMWLCTSSTALSTLTSCIWSQGCLLPWTVTWDFIFKKKNSIFSVPSNPQHIVGA